MDLDFWIVLKGKKPCLITEEINTVLCCDYSLEWWTPFCGSLGGIEPTQEYLVRKKIYKNVFRSP